MKPESDWTKVTVLRIIGYYGKDAQLIISTRQLVYVNLW